MRQLILLTAISTLILLALACGASAPPTPTRDINAVVVETLAAHTVEAALTAAVIPPTATMPPSPPPTATTPSLPPPTTAPSPTATILPTAAPQEIAPEPLPASNTGIVLYPNDCFDLDTGGVSAALTPGCDLLVPAPMLLRPQNGAQISGYVTFEVPTRSQCLAARYEPGDLSPNSDLYMCFRTNAGRYGFIVQRMDAPGAPPGRMIVDYWVFR